MRNAIAVLGFAVALPAAAYECPRHDRATQSIEHHIELASEIALGTVIAGRIDEDAENQRLIVSVRVHHNFKGALPQVVEIRTEVGTPFYDVVLGSTNIFFLYGRRELDFCGYLIPVDPHVQSYARLVEWNDAALEFFAGQALPPRNTNELVARLLVHFRAAP